MVLRKALEQINRVGGWWDAATIGSTSNLTSSRREAETLRDLLAAIVADWPTDAPPTPAVNAARDYLRRRGATEE